MEASSPKSKAADANAQEHPGDGIEPDNTRASSHTSMISFSSLLKSSTPIKRAASSTSATSTPKKRKKATDQADERASLEYYFRQPSRAPDGAVESMKAEKPASLPSTPQKHTRPGLESQQSSGIDTLKAYREIQNEQHISSSPVKKSKHVHGEKTQQTAHERVIPEQQWRYQIKYMDSMGPITDDENAKKNALNDRSFTDRKRANEYLNEKSSPESVGGLEDIIRRSVSLEGPERLLKVEIELQNGQHHLMWVERSLGSTRKLEMKQLGQTQRRPVSRPKLIHYVVTCEFVNYDRTYTQEPNDNNPSEDGPVEEHASVTIEKIPPQTFTSREMANKHAAQLFLERSRVPRGIADVRDEYWWQNNAVPVQQKALRKASKRDGLFEAMMDTYEMTSRLGWDQIVVLVQKIDDISGPVNF